MPEDSPLCPNCNATVEPDQKSCPQCQAPFGALWWISKVDLLKLISELSTFKWLYRSSYSRDFPNLIEEVIDYPEKVARLYAQRNWFAFKVISRQLQYILTDEEDEPQPFLYIYVMNLYCRETKELMRKAMENSALPPPLRRKMEYEYSRDGDVLHRISNTVQPRQPAESILELLTMLGEIHQRWEKYANYEGLPERS